MKDNQLSKRQVSSMFPATRLSNVESFSPLKCFRDQPSTKVRGLYLSWRAKERSCPKKAAWGQGICRRCGRNTQQRNTLSRVPTTLMIQPSTWLLITNFMIDQYSNVNLYRTSYEGTVCQKINFIHFNPDVVDWLKHVWVQINLC